MNSATMIKLMLAGSLAIAVASTSSAMAQTTLGGAKTQQNKIGGVAKPAPAVGGAVVHTPTPPPPPKPVVNAVKPTSPGVTTPGLGSNAALNQPPGPKQNPPVTSPNKGGAVVTNNMKCSGGACTSVVPKP
jgi:hypothetical protein